MLAALTTLAHPDASRAERSRAACALAQELERRLRAMLGSLARSLSQADIEDIQQHVLMAASVGAARFRGTTEGEAHNWCRTTACNAARDRLGDANREPVGREEDLATGQRVAAAGPVAMPSDTRRDLEQIDVVSKAAEDALLCADRANGPQKVERLRCYLQYRLGAGIDEQIAAFGYDGTPPKAPTPDEHKRARNRVYQYRKRGRDYGLEAHATLAREGDLDEAALALFRMVLDGTPEAALASKE